jgi:hypothetical protein
MKSAVEMVVAAVAAAWAAAAARVAAAAWAAAWASAAAWAARDSGVWRPDMAESSGGSRSNARRSRRVAADNGFVVVSGDGSEAVGTSFDSVRGS